MNKKYNLVKLVEAWLNKEIDTEEMKKTYADLPRFVPVISKDADHTIYSNGSGNTHLEVRADLVGGKKMTIDEYLDWRDIVKDIKRVNTEGVNTDL